MANFCTTVSFFLALISATAPIANAQGPTSMAEFVTSSKQKLEQSAQHILVSREAFESLLAAVNSNCIVSGSARLDFDHGMRIHPEHLVARLISRTSMAYAKQGVFLEVSNGAEKGDTLYFSLENPGQLDSTAIRNIGPRNCQ